MLNGRLEMELQKSVREGNLELLRNYLSLLDAFTNNTAERLGLLLHDATSLEIAIELIKHGADIDARNGVRETPLHSAITLGKDPNLILELLKHGASVHASDYEGSTPLYLALTTKGRNLHVVQALLEFGADINVPNRERRQFGNHYSALDIAVYDLECAKLMIKYTVMQNFEIDCRKIVDLDPYRDFSNYKKLSAYLDECSLEIIRMQTDKVTNNVMMYDFIIMNEDILDHFYSKSKDMKDMADEVFIRVFNDKYPVYQDIVLSKLGRAYLAYKLSNLQIFTEFNVSDNCIGCVNLDGYSTLNISKYLSHLDMLNLIKAFYN